MSLICETIVSEDELSPKEEELDFEEEEIPKSDDDKDEGELSNDEDLEEGEVKEDDDEDNSEVRVETTQTTPQNNRQNSICRFYGRGQCTWGNNCRFVHPTGGMIKRLPPPPPPPPPMAIMAGGGGGRRAREWVEPNNESAWERGLKQAKEMIVRASRRKEEEIDFEDKRFNLSVEENNESNESPNHERYDEEYERRRRLAFESAPWNNEEPPGARLRQAETYRDPWRRSKSPPMSAGKGRRPPIAGSRSGSKRSHSMSSISASGSDSSDFSGSEGSESFSESSGSQVSGRSGGGRRLNRKTVSEKKSFPSEQRFGKIAKKALNYETKENYDSWSESLSDSDSISSYYSESETEKTRIPKRQQTSKRLKPEDPNNSIGPPLKKVKSAPMKKSETEPKKSPIKMTFMKKQNMKKENFKPSLAFKANGEPLAEQLEEDNSVAIESPLAEESPQSPRGLQATFSRREELLQQLKAVEDAIARKRSKIN